MPNDKDKKSAYIGFYISPDLKAEIAKIAASERRSVSMQTRVIVEEWLCAPEFPPKNRANA